MEEKITLKSLTEKYGKSYKFSKCNINGTEYIEITWISSTDYLLNKSIGLATTEKQIEDFISGFENYTGSDNI